MPFADRWDGSEWKDESAPVPSGATYGELSGVSCVSSSFCAAVGSFVDSSGERRALGVNWNGTSWSNSSVPIPGAAESSGLSGVSCVAADVCSAVGEYEANSDELPLVIRWDGTSWSQQPIDTETYGAVATVPRSVSCVSSMSCHATGSITYGHAATPRQLAYRFDGTSWILTESGNYQRTWSALERLGDSYQGVTIGDASVSCPSTTFCMRVGSVTEDGVESGRVRSWNGNTWSDLAIPSPPEAAETALRGVACFSREDCRAVGSYLDSEGVRKTLAMSWNGSSWSIATTPNPSGASASEPTSMRCTSTSFCVAVGSYLDSEGVRKTLAMSWNGSSWSIATTPNPSGASASELTSLSCRSASFCVATGSYVDIPNVGKTLAMSWNGSSWSIATTPNPSGASTSELRAVSCAATTFCLAVGSYLSSSGETKTQAMKYGGSSWTPVPTTDLEDATKSVLSGISCTSISTCLAVGEYATENRTAALMMIFKLAGSTWTGSANRSADPSGAARSALSAVGCASASACMAVGSVAMEEKAPTELAESFNGANWTRTDPVKIAATWNGVSCRSNDPCVAVGSSVVGQDRTQQAMIRTGSGWESMELPGVAQADLRDVSCAGDEECTAVGSQGTSSTALAERWDGTQWSTQTTPNPNGSWSVALSGVSCASGGLCVAVGRFANGSSPANPLIEKWNGSSWTIQTPSMPSGAKQAWLEDVSCPSTTACVAVGGFEDSSGVRHGLIERWNGTSWASQTPPKPSGATRTDLNGISCKSTACTAVGSYWNSSGRHTYILRWNGSAWSIQSSPNPATSSANELTDVSCFTSSKCVASGTSEPTSSAPNPYPIAMGWDGTTWSLETIPVLEAWTAGALYGISCTAAADCVAVGTSSAGFGGDWEGLSVRSVEPNAPPPSEVTSAPPEAEFTLTPGQEVDAINILKADPHFQATLGAEEFTVDGVIPWLELTAEGDEVLVGAVLEVTMDEAGAWGQWWKWPAAEYEGYYEFGTYSEETVEASASDVVELVANLDATLDSSGQFLEGEMVQLQPVVDDDATVELAPSQGP